MAEYTPTASELESDQHLVGIVQRKISPQNLAGNIAEDNSDDVAHCANAASRAKRCQRSSWIFPRATLLPAQSAPVAHPD